MVSEHGLKLTLSVSDLLDNYEMEYLRFHKRESKVNNHRIDKLKICLGSLDYLTTTLIEQNLLKKFPKSSPAHRNRYRALLKAALRWGHARGLVEGDIQAIVALKVEKEHNERTRRLDPDKEEKRIYEALSPDMRDLFIAALDTGLRFGALTQLTFADIEDGKAIVVRGSTQKNKKPIRIPMTKRLKEIISKRINSIVGAGNVVKVDDKIFCIKGWESQWRKVRKDLNITDLHWHDLRGEFASRLAEKGVPPHVIQAILGHQSIVTTQRYLRSRVQQFDDAIESLGV